MTTLTASTDQEPAAPPEPTPPAAPWLRLREAMPSDRLLGWLGPLAIALVAGVLRFWNLGQPRAFIFDETYYAKDAWSLLKFGSEHSSVDGANDRILAGDLNVFNVDPSFVAHPPAGKWVIALGEHFWGLNPFGWRVMVALLGTLSVLMIGRIARRLFRSTLLGCTAALLLTLDGMHLVQSRTALLDLILMFFVLAAFGCLLLDRDWSRAELQRRTERAVARGELRTSTRRLGPRIGWRPWRLAAGVLLGLACATKWSGLPYVAVFGLFIMLWDYGARRAAGATRPLLGVLSRDSLGNFAAIVGAALVTYVAAWWGWLAGDNGYARGATSADLSGKLGGLLEHLPGPLRALCDYHVQMWQFNSNLTEGHPYASNPWSWVLLGRPVSYFYEGPTQGQDGCTVETCSKAILAVGTPAIWWAAALAIPVLLFFWLLRRDWRAGAIMLGLLAGYLPWFRFQERTIYSFYSVAFVPWLVLAVVFCLGLILGTRTDSEFRRRWGAAVVGGYVLLVVVNFWYLYPILVGHVIPYDSWSNRMWFQLWI